MPSCEYGRCKEESDVYYEGHHICDKHYKAFCDGEIDLDKYFKVTKRPVQLTIGLKNYA